jgi:ATP-binding cassette, subfamily B, bacterial
VRRQLSLIRYARPQWRGISTILALTGVSIALGLLGPWPMKLLIDNVFGVYHRRQPLPPPLRQWFHLLPGPATLDWLLFWVALATVVIFVLNTLISMLESYVGIGVRQRMTYALGGDLYRHMQRLSLRFHSRRPVGDSIARVTGDPACVPMITLDACLPVLQAVVTLVAYFVILFLMKPALTLVALAVVPFLFLSIRLFGRPMQRRTRVRRDLEGHMMTIVEHTLGAIPVVQSFTREDVEYERFQGYARSTVRAYQRATFSSLWFNLFVGLSTAAGTAAIILLGGLYVLHGQMTPGTLIVFVAYLALLYGPLNAITYTAETLSYAFAQAERVLEVLDAPIEVQDSPGAPGADMRGVIRYEGVSFGYETGQPVLKNISLEGGPGDVVAIVGPTGAGKTTLVNLLVRFFDPWSGRITVDGEDLRSFTYRSVREQVALVLQDPFIFPYTVAENIAYGRPEASQAEIEAAARNASAHEFIVRLPEGYDTVVGERGATLSGGERQRLSIARAFLKDAPVLILDEPTSALDAQTEFMLLGALERLMKGRLTFIIAHRLSTIRNADRILVLDHGEIVEQGRHADIVQAEGLYASLYRRQMDVAQHESGVTRQVAAYR